MGLEPIVNHRETLPDTIYHKRANALITCVVTSVDYLKYLVTHRLGIGPVVEHHIIAAHLVVGPARNASYVTHIGNRQPQIHLLQTRTINSRHLETVTARTLVTHRKQHLDLVTNRNI